MKKYKKSKINLNVYFSVRSAFIFNLILKKYYLMKCSMKSFCLTSNLQLILKWVLSEDNRNIVSSKWFTDVKILAELESVFFEIDIIVRKLKLYKWFQKTLWYNILYRNENIRFKKETNINAREIDIILMKIFSPDSFVE